MPFPNNRSSPDVIIGRSPGNPPGPTNDINVGTTPETAFTVNFVAGAEVIYNSQTPYTGVEIFNRNTLNVQGGKFDELGFQSHENSVINISGGSGFGVGAYYGASDSFDVRAFDNSVINFNGAAYCHRISASDTATINVNSVNSNGIALQSIGSSNLNINPGADVRSVTGVNIVVNGGHITLLSPADSCIVNAGEISSTTVIAETTNILGGSIASLNAGEFGNGTHYDGVSNVRGGTIGTISNGDFSTIKVYGGAISDIATRESSMTNIYGGTIGHNTLSPKIMASSLCTAQD